MKLSETISQFCTLTLFLPQLFKDLQKVALSPDVICQIWRVYVLYIWLSILDQYSLDERSPDKYLVDSNW
ncbi:MAG: hypothetical protein Kow00121_01140 [Elainellaceae cyanobacterium]